VDADAARVPRDYGHRQAHFPPTHPTQQQQQKQRQKTLHQFKLNQTNHPRHQQFPFKSKTGFRITSSVARLATNKKLQQKLDGYKVGTRKQFERVKRLVGEYERHTANKDRNSAGLAAALSLIFAPATAHLYFGIAVRGNEKYRDEFMKATQRGLAQAVARTRVQREAPTTETIKTMLRTIEKHFKFFVILQCVTASRHADIMAAKIAQWEEKSTLPQVPAGWAAVRLEMGPWKSDPTGKLLNHKWFVWPAKWKTALLKIWENKAKYSYDKLHGKMHNWCNPHDLRRWAMTKLAEKCDHPEEILLLTAHAAATKATTHIRRYVTPSPMTAEAKKQLQMSAILWTLLC